MAQEDYSPLGVTWQRLDDDELRRIVAGIAGLPIDALRADSLQAVTMERCELPFYQAHRLLRISRKEADGRRRESYFLEHAKGIEVLDGRSMPIYEANAREGREIAEPHRMAYLRLFFFFVRGEEGAFTLLESPSQVGEPTESDSTRAATWPAVRQRLMQSLRPLRALGEDGKGNSRFNVVVHYADSVFECDVLVMPTGMVEMVDDRAIEQSLPAGAIRRLPDLEWPNRLIGMIAQSDANAPVQSEGADPAAAIINDRELTRRFVAVLLQRAQQRPGDHVLLDHFNPSSDKRYPLKQLARLVISTWPVVVIESDIPFVEELIAELLMTESGILSSVPLIRATTEPEAQRLRFDRELRDHGIMLMPLLAYRTVADVERIAHEIAVREVAAMIGCRRLADVPEPLRRGTDLVLSLPEVDDDLFVELFGRIMDRALPADWQQGGTEWVRYVLPTDFHQAAKLKLDSGRALEYIRGRIRERLNQVDADSGPGLADLHGMIEARQMAEDLIADIHSARAGAIPWSEVDRGMLLAGPPGTGKTTLARAIAKDCGVRFVTASASAWQAAGHLDEHLRAIRASFAEARRYAPSILFIDEIDSIGNRGNFSGSNAQYGTAVVNGVLDEMQGLDEKAPVFVIAATNHADRVDPALKRSGRLDRVIEIPYPNVEGLVAIYEFHLRRYRVQSSLADDVDVPALAAMSFGLTGADVERIVRGGARRARKAERRLAQQDLIAEISGKPRVEGGAGRLTDHDMKVVAVHEAGHALARFLNDGDSARIAFVSIVPRADGSLGFVATLPADRQLMRRRDFLALMEVFLAGRAAEAIEFGPDEVSSGAGGFSQRSDLAAATQLATQFVCRQGMLGEDALAWSELPDEAQRREINRLLFEAYRSVMDKLTGKRGLLTLLANALVARQELTGKEVADVLRQPSRSPV
ncbi:AAA family ATPase [Thauera sp.]